VCGACSSEGYIDKKNDRRMDDCLRYALVSGKKALEDAGLKQDSDAFKALNKQRCASLQMGTRAARASSRPARAGAPIGRLRRARCAQGRAARQKARVWAR
jgi:3-oxoacyl-(acyl-carrier-protein) synthase